jgi:hypothetical protein
MGRMKRTDTQFTFRAEFDAMEWFKDYCKRNGTSASEEIRKWIQSLKRKDQRTQRKGETS